jgi:AcrR family transcriptional regulator
MTSLFERIPEEKRNRILDAAVNEFSNLGFENANTNKIAARAGISVGSLFQYFENKEDVFLTTVNYCASVLKIALENILVEEEDIFIKVEKVLRAILKHSRENGNMIRLYNEITTNSNSRLVLQTVENIEGMTAKLYTEIIERLQKQGEARDDCDPRMLAFFIDNMFMMLQFSYSCSYYQERFKLYAGEDVFLQDDLLVENALKFIKSAFTKK